jgi:hypothetical protein
MTTVERRTLSDADIRVTPVPVSPVPLQPAGIPMQPAEFRAWDSDPSDPCYWICVDDFCLDDAI